MRYAWVSSLPNESLTENQGSRTQVIIAGATAGLISRYVVSQQTERDILTLGLQIRDCSSGCCKDPPPTTNPFPLRSIVASRLERFPDIQRHSPYNQAHTPRGRDYRVMEGQYSGGIDVRVV